MKISMSVTLCTTVQVMLLVKIDQDLGNVHVYQELFASLYPKLAVRMTASKFNKKTFWKVSLEKVMVVLVASVHLAS